MPDPIIPIFANCNMRPACIGMRRLTAPHLSKFVANVEAYAIFEGGATLVAAYIGSLILLETAGVQFKRIAGNSAGAITAALVAAGYKANEIECLMSNFQNPRIAKPGSLQGIGCN